jgi:hypothetical protein
MSAAPGLVVHWRAFRQVNLLEAGVRTIPRQPGRLNQRQSPQKCSTRNSSKISAEAATHNRAGKELFGSEQFCQWHAMQNRQEARVQQQSKDHSKH